MPTLDLPRDEWEMMESVLLRVPKELRDARWHRCIDSVHMILEAIKEASYNYISKKP